ncbi:hypothetical protein T440DRAFT_397992 [Plenodomus tracheiphilus IPT5]|uniref:Uncharacterized protein n=1 Tax=Plenodomus tracheiphilus IPT5 TaxID=1408161 RepID=A0A6A7B3J5_9PLEO|nr:hypothetical protein T440DRAFT_397992 [Plenodomus tracheiphilus IPT5]
MAAFTQASDPAAAAAAQANHIRTSMSLANLLTGPDPVAPEQTPPQMLVAPSSPTQAIVSIEERIGSTEVTVSELSEAGIQGQSAQQGGSSEAPTGSSEIKQESNHHNDDTSDVMDESHEDTAADDAQDVPDAERDFICMNDPCGRCMTGQYTKDLSRKVISDHFGRNKACTRDIIDWPLFCRKHYQRATYNKPRWQVRKLELILRQFDLIEEQFPGTTYDIAFKKSEEGRLNKYSRLVASEKTTQEAEQLVLPVAGKHFEAPIDVLRELDRLMANDKTYAEVRGVVNVISQMLESGDTEQVPSVEFLPKVPGKTKKSPSKARASKSPRTPKRSKTPKSPGTPGTPSRVSAKGSVKKTSSKA